MKFNCLIIAAFSVPVTPSSARCDTFCVASHKNAFVVDVVIFDLLLLLLLLLAVVWLIFGVLVLLFVCLKCLFLFCVFLLGLLFFFRGGGGVCLFLFCTQPGTRKALLSSLAACTC